MTRDIREVVREEPLMRRRLLDLLADEPMTVPELAAAGGFAADDVMVWVMGLRKYGQITEADETAEGLFRYRTVAPS